MPVLHKDEIEIPVRELVLGLVGVYNRGHWPAAIFGCALAFAAVAFVLVKPGALADAVAKILLDLLWLWTGAMFFLDRFASEFHVALLFGIAFIIQGTFFLVDVFYGNLEFRPYRSRPALVTTLFLLAAAAVVHPLAASALGRGWPQLTLVGTAPGPTAAVTLCLLTLTLHKPRPLFFVIPAGWALVASFRLAQAWRLYEELILAGVTLVVVLWFLYATWRASAPAAPGAAEGAPS